MRHIMSRYISTNSFRQNRPLGTETYLAKAAGKDRAKSIHSAKPIYEKPYIDQMAYMDSCIQTRKGRAKRATNGRLSRVRSPQNPALQPRGSSLFPLDFSTIALCLARPLDPSRPPPRAHHKGVCPTHHYPIRARASGHARAPSREARTHTERPRMAWAGRQARQQARAS
jgi:hypothetical protein